MNRPPIPSADPYQLEEMVALVAVLEQLHGHELAKDKLRIWAESRRFSEEAFQYVIRYIE